MKLSIALILFLVVVLWGASFTVLKLGLEKIPPITLAFLRFLIPLPILTMFTCSKSKYTFSRDIRENWKIYSILGLTGVTLCHIFQNFGLRLTRVSNASLIIASSPIFMALLGHYYLKEEISFKRALGIALAFLGVLIIIRPFEWSLNPLNVIGSLLSLSTALCWASYSVLNRKILLRQNVNQVTTSSLIFGTLFLLPVALAFEKPMIPTSAWTWFLLLFLSLLCTGLGYLLYSKALEEVTATEVGIFQFFIPVVSVLIAHIVLLESMDAFLIIGALLILVGILFTEYVR